MLRPCATPSLGRDSRRRSGCRRDHYLARSVSLLAAMNPTANSNIAPWLAVRDAQKALVYYKAAFGAVELYRLPAYDGSLAVGQLSGGWRSSWSRRTATPSRQELGPDGC